MKFLIIFALTLTTCYGWPNNEIQSRNVVVPAGTPEGRVTRGHNAVKGQFTYQAGLILQHFDGKYTWCGASLINNTRIVTAAHCTENVYKVQVLLGAVDRNNPEVVHEVTYKDIVIHPKWNTNTVENDISIIKIPYTSYTDNIKPVKLPAKGSSYSTYDGETVTASGWGRVSDTAAGVTDHLQYASMSVIPNYVCSYTFPVKDSNICISTSGKVSTCNGDSGGPLVSEPTKTLVGITSYGAAAGCEKNLPAVFTRVTSYLDWIKQQ